MMPTTGSYAGLLRALGQTLDQQQARNIEIIEREVFLKVSFDFSWESPEGTTQQRVYNDFDLTSLAEQAQRLRNHSPRGGEHGELLRTLGQELDAAGINLGSIAEDRTNYRVRGSAPGGNVDRMFSFAELRALSAERRRLRRPDAPLPPGPPTSPPRPWWRWWQR